MCAWHSISSCRGSALRGYRPSFCQCRRRRRACRGGNGAGLSAELRPVRVHRRPAAWAPGTTSATIRVRRWSTSMHRPVPAGLHLQDDHRPGGDGAGISPAYQVFCPGYMSLGRSVFHCWKEHGHGGSRWSRRWASPTTSSSMIWPVGSVSTRRRHGWPPRARPEAGHRPARRAARPDPHDRLEEGDIGRELPKGETLVCGIGQGFVSTTPLQLAIMAARLGMVLAVTPGW